MTAAQMHIARSFGQAAAYYDEYADLQRQVAERLLDGIKGIAVSASGTVLDLGCGTGYCAGKLSARFPAAQLVALDLAEPMVRAAALHHTQLLCADMLALPLQNSVASLAVSSLSLQWCVDVQQVFSELFRVLRPGGQALLSTFGPATLRELGSAWSVADAHVHVNKFVGQASLEQAARAVGFTVSAIREVKVRHYASLRAIARELKGIGAHNMNDGRSHGLTPRAVFARAEQEFSKGLVPGRGIPVTWEVYYLDLRKP